MKISEECFFGAGSNIVGYRCKSCGMVSLSSSDKPMQGWKAKIKDGWLDLYCIECMDKK